MKIIDHPHTGNNPKRRWKPGAARVADTFRRAACARCEEPVITLGEAIRVDRVEGGFEIIHLCTECVTSGAYLALKASAEVAARPVEREVRRAA